MCRRNFVALDPDRPGRPASQTQSWTKRGRNAGPLSAAESVPTAKSHTVRFDPLLIGYLVSPDASRWLTGAPSPDAELFRGPMGSLGDRRPRYRTGAQ